VATLDRIPTRVLAERHDITQLGRRPGRRYISEVPRINRCDPDADLFDYVAVFLAKQDHR